MNALAALAPQVDPEALGDAAGARSDIGALLRALEAPAALTALAGDDPLAEAWVRDIALREEILRAEGGTLTAAQVAGLPGGISTQAVNKRRREGVLLGLPVGRHRYVYPGWQFDDRGVLPGLPRTLAALTLPDPWTQAAFFLGENTYLDGARPLDLLRRGEIERVIEAAQVMGEQGG